MWYKIVISLMVSIALKVVFGELVVKRFFDVPTVLIVIFAVLFSLLILFIGQWRTKKTKTT